MWRSRTKARKGGERDRISLTLSLVKQREAPELTFAIYFPWHPYWGAEYKAARVYHEGSQVKLFNFVGLVLGSRGTKVQCIQAASNAKIEICNERGNLNGARPDPADRTLHALVTADTLPDLCKAVQELLEALHPKNTTHYPFDVVPGGRAVLVPVPLPAWKQRFDADNPLATRFQVPAPAPLPTLMTKDEPPAALLEADDKGSPTQRGARRKAQCGPTHALRAPAVPALLSPFQALAGATHREHQAVALGKPHRQASSPTGPVQVVFSDAHATSAMHLGLQGSLSQSCSLSSASVSSCPSLCEGSGSSMDPPPIASYNGPAWNMWVDGPALLWTPELLQTTTHIVHATKPLANDRTAVPPRP